MSENKPSAIFLLLFLDKWFKDKEWMVKADEDCLRGVCMLRGGSKSIRVLVEKRRAQFNSCVEQKERHEIKN